MSLASVQIAFESPGVGVPAAIAFSSVVTAGSLLVYYISGSDAVPWEITGVTDTQGNTWQLAVSAHGAGEVDEDGAEIWYAMNANAGATTVTAVSDQGSLNHSQGIQEVSGVALAAALDTTGSNVYVGGNPTVSAEDVSSRDNSFLAAASAQFLALESAWGAPIGYSQIYDNADGASAVYKIETAAYAEIADWTRQIGESASVIAVFKEAFLPDRGVPRGVNRGAIT